MPEISYTDDLLDLRRLFKKSLEAIDNELKANGLAQDDLRGRK
jgi:hypothetical protein